MNHKYLAIGLILTNVLFSPTRILAAPAAPLLPIMDNQIGIVAAVRGTVKISNQAEVGRIVSSGQSIYLGDEVATDGEGNLQILLMDETIFTIGPNSAISIDKFIYDPATHDGEVKAKVVKGIFRFVTGKIGQKDPKQVEVDLPSGTIGIRGTIIAGEVTGKKSTVILFGPGANNNTRHRTGSFVLTNKVSGRNQQELVNKTGFGSTIEGDDFAPSKPFQVSAEQMAKVAHALGPISEMQDSGNARQVADEKSESPVGDHASATERSGQEKVHTKQFLRQAGNVGKMMQAFTEETGEAAQKITEGSGLHFQNGPASRNQLQLLAQIRGGGVGHFSGSSLLSTGGTANFSIDIDFGSRTVGGGYSKVDGNLAAGGGSDTFTFNLPSRAFGFGNDNAAFSFNGLTNASAASSCKTSGCNSANVTLGIDNVNGGIANGSHIGITILDNGGSVSSTGSSTAVSADGASV